MKLFYILLSIGILFGAATDTTFAKKNTHKTTKTKRAKPKTITQLIKTITRTKPAQIRTAPPSIVYGPSQLAREINRIIKEEANTNDLTVYVKSMEYGDTLYMRNIYRPLTPASTLKILTAEAALIFLGPEYRFATQLLTDAKTVRNGILQGNLYVVLSGDPSLTYYELVELLNNLKSQQIWAISGNVYLDNTAYDQSFYGPGWDIKDKSYCYAAPISASIINHNCLSFKVTPSKMAGHTAQVVTSPNYFYPAIKNSVTTKTERTHTCAVHLSSGPSSMISIDGCLARGPYSTGVSYVVTDIPEYNRALFKNLFNRLSISVYGTVTFGSAPESLSMIGQHASKPLRLLINDMLKKSDNIIAGALFKKLGQLYSHKPGSWENGSFAVSQILSKRVGVNVAGLRILDGSGLSPNNLVTSAQMMQVLDFAYHHYPTSYEFISALPIAGIDGTLKHRIKNTTKKICLTGRFNNEKLIKANAGMTICKLFNRQLLSIDGTTISVYDNKVIAEAMHFGEANRL